MVEEIEQKNKKLWVGELRVSVEVNKIKIFKKKRINLCV